MTRLFHLLARPPRRMFSLPCPTAWLPRQTGVHP